ncbi:MAG: SPFH domain-containing protein [Thermomicrobiales bacterium]
MAIIDLIQWPDERPDQVVHRVPERGSGEFVLGSQLVVRESQSAVFVRDGKALDTFSAGRHTLSTNNIPLLTSLIGLPFGGTSPFTAEVFFVALREFTSLKWGTTQPLTYRDSDLGMVRLRAFGTYSMQVDNPQLFVTHVVGTRGGYSLSAIEDFLRSLILNEFNDLLGGTHTSILDLPGMTMELANGARLALADDFQRIGLRLVTFQIEGITPPEDVQKRIDERSSMAAIGDMQTYTQFQTAQAMRDAAQNPSGGGAAGIGVGLGAGAAMGQAMAGALSQPAPAQQPAQQSVPAGAPCANCGKSVPAGANFCPSCGTPVSQTCANCGAANSGTAKFCSECGKPLT